MVLFMGFFYGLNLKEIDEWLLFGNVLLNKYFWLGLRWIFFGWGCSDCCCLCSCFWF